MKTSTEEEVIDEEDIVEPGRSWVLAVRPLQDCCNVGEAVIVKEIVHGRHAQLVGLNQDDSHVDFRPWDAAQHSGFKAFNVN